MIKTFQLCRINSEQCELIALDQNDQVLFKKSFYGPCGYPLAHNFALSYIPVSYFHIDGPGRPMIIDDDYHEVCGETNPLVSLLKKNNYRITSGIKSKLLIEQDNKCYFCQCVLTIEEATVDHLVPRSKGGKTNKANCVAACKPCNNKKGSMSEQEFRELMTQN